MIPKENDANEEKKSKGKLRFLTWAFTLLIVGIPLFYAVENWRGERAFEKMLAELRTKGEPSSFRDTFLSAIPDEENFFKQKLVLAEKAGDNKPEIERIKGDNFKELEKYFSRATSLHKSELNDYVAWLTPSERTSDMTQKEAAKRILKITNIYHGRMDKIAELIRAFKFEAEIPDESELFPTGGEIFQFQKIMMAFADRSELRLLAGETSLALHDLETMATAASKTSRNSLVELLVSSNAEKQIDTLIWRALEIGNLDDPSLRHMSTILNYRPDLEPILSRVAKYERVYTMTILAKIGRDRSLVDQNLFLGWTSIGDVDWKDKDDILEYLKQLKLQYGPKGWYLLAAVRFSDDVEEYLLGPTSLKAGILSLETRDRIAMDFPDGSATMLDNLLSFYPKMIEALLCSAAERRLAQAAVAVARYELAEGKLPRSLAEVCPKYLMVVPTDPFSRSGAEIFYEVKKDGSPKFWSIGLDEVNQGGLATGKRAEDSADIVWQYTK